MQYHHFHLRTWAAVWHQYKMMVPRRWRTMVVPAASHYKTVAARVRIGLVPQSIAGAVHAPLAASSSSTEGSGCGSGCHSPRIHLVLWLASCHGSPYLIPIYPLFVRCHTAHPFPSLSTAATRCHAVRSSYPQLHLYYASWLPATAAAAPRTAGAAGLLVPTPNFVRKPLRACVYFAAIVEYRSHALPCRSCP